MVMVLPEPQSVPPVRIAATKHRKEAGIHSPLSARTAWAAARAGRAYLRKAIGNVSSRENINVSFWYGVVGG